MKIVFITPTTALKSLPIYRSFGKVYGQPNSITGPLILGGILKRAGHRVEVYEELNGSVPLDRLMEDTDVFSFYIMASNAPRAYKMAQKIRKNSNARIIMGGIHADAMPEEALKYADQVMTGEGEQVILDVVEGRITDRIVRGIPYDDLDKVPFPDYSILRTPCVSANVLSTRGCPYRCTFCTTSRMFEPYRQRSVDNVIDELHMYKTQWFLVALVSPQFYGMIAVSDAPYAEGLKAAGLVGAPIILLCIAITFGGDLSTINPGIAAPARYIYTMAEDHSLPKF
ncbi:MAG: cobalamin-dependent protein, partial [Anaerovoracaceae bacterium]|nr:cobalamin-dependent protein [Anaerovoracaceae bacterium]